MTSSRERINLLGIQIERKTDILAFAAFLLSLSSIAYQGASMLRGARVTLLAPRQVTIYLRQFGHESEDYLTFLTSMEYVNSGPPGMNDVVAEESVSFTLAGRSYTHVWHQFVSAVDRKEEGEGSGSPKGDYRLNVHNEQSVHA